MITNTLISSKTIRYSSYALFGCVFILAIIYTKERLFADASYYFFHSINQGYPQVDHDRITLLLAQTLPLLGLYLGLSVKILVYLHSIGHVVFFFALFLYVTFKKKLPYHGLALALVSVTGVSVLFFSPMLEIWYGIALAIVFDAELKNPIKNTLGHLLFSVFLLVFIALSHPENFGVLLFVVALHVIKKGASTKVLLGFSTIILVLFLYKWFTFSEYEAGKINWGLNADENHFYTDRTQLSYYLDWFIMLLKNYYDCLIYLLIGIYYYYKNKEYKSILLVVSAIIGFSFIIHYTNKADEYTRYIESVHMPLVAMSLIVFIDTFSRITSKTTATLLLMANIGFFATRVYFISEMGNDLSKRVTLMEQFITDSRAKKQYKSIVTEQDFEGYPGYYKTWSVSIETLILSTMSDPNNPCYIITDDDYNFEQNNSISNKGNFIFRRWEIQDNNWIRKSLFKTYEKDYEQLY